MHVYQSYFEKLLVTELCLGMSSNEVFFCIETASWIMFMKHDNQVIIRNQGLERVAYDPKSVKKFGGIVE